MFWIFFTITLYLIFVMPVDFASFIGDATAALFRFLRSFASFFQELRS